MKVLLFLITFLLLLGYQWAFGQETITYQVDSTQEATIKVTLLENGDFKYIQKYNTDDGQEVRATWIVTRDQAIAKQNAEMELIESKINQFTEQRTMHREMLHQIEKELDQTRSRLKYWKARRAELYQNWIDPR